MTSGASAKWFVIRSRPQQEIRAVVNLERQGYIAYLPRYARVERRGDKVIRSIRPVFPRYLFMQLGDAKRGWAQINSTYGVSALVSIAGIPVEVPRCIVQEIRDREDADGMVRLGRGRPLGSGDRVRVVSGAFAENIGLFDTVIDSERVAILLDTLGRKVRVILDGDAVMAEGY